MKYVLIIGDGMADTKLPELAGKTPLEALALPAFDRAAGCFAGRVLTVPHGMPPGSDTAILSIFGYDPRTYYTGRSVLEAAGMGVFLPEGSCSLRVNLCTVLPDEEGRLIIHSHNGGGIHGAEVKTLMRDLLANPSFASLLKEMSLSITATDTFRHVGVIEGNFLDLSSLILKEPHNILLEPIDTGLPHIAGENGDTILQKLCSYLNQFMSLSYELLKDHTVNISRVDSGKLPANMLWPWGAATAVTLPPFESLFGHKGVVISAVPLVWGIAGLASLETPQVEGANGELDTNYEGKADKALSALLTEGYDFAAVHIEAPDEMAHAGNLAAKLEAIQNVESRVTARILDKLLQSGEDFRLLLLSDHPTLLTTRMHDGNPVPFAIYDSRTERKAVASGGKPPQRKYCEEELLCEPVLMDGTELLTLLFKEDK